MLVGYYKDTHWTYKHPYTASHFGKRQSDAQCFPPLLCKLYNDAADIVQSSVPAGRGVSIFVSQRPTEALHDALDLPRACQCARRSEPVSPRMAPRLLGSPVTCSEELAGRDGGTGVIEARS